MDTVDRHPGRSVRRESPDFAVTDDLAGLPVTAAELDAVEAFLSAALRDLFKEDSEPPQTHAEIVPSPRKPGAGP